MSIPHRPSRPPRQAALPLDPSPEELMQAAEWLRLSRAHLRKQYQSLDALLADPERARWFLICARNVLRGWQRGKPRT